jgi:hypothetical protein
MKIKSFCLFLFLLSIVFFPQKASSFQKSNENIFKLVPEDFLKAPEGIDISLNQVYKFDFDYQENIFILDRGNYRILKFSGEGQFVKSFSRKGRGPGELWYPDQITIGPDNKVYISTGNKLSVYSNNGEYGKDITLYPQNRRTYFSLVFNGPNQIIGWIYDPSGIEYKDRRTALIMNYIGSYDLSSKKSVIFGNVYKTNVGSVDIPIVAPVIDSNRNIFYALNDIKKYQIFMYSNEGVLLKELTKDYKPVAIPKKEIEEQEARMKQLKRTGKGQLLGDDFFKISKFYKSIKELHIDFNDYLWVFTNEGTPENLLSADIWNSNGNYKKTVCFSTHFLIKNLNSKRLRKNYLFAIIKDENDEEKFVRFRLPDEIWK